MKAILSFIQEKLPKTLNVEQNDITRDDVEKAASYDRPLNLLKEKVDKQAQALKKLNF